MSKRTQRVWHRFATLALALAVAFVLAAVPSAGKVYAAAPKPTRITLKTTAKTVDIKGKVTVSVKSVRPAKASKAVTWKSSNKKVATVSSKGVVTGKKKGAVTITATSKANKKVKKTIRIAVKNIKPKSVVLNKKSATLAIGKTASLKATVKPAGVYAPITWKSSNTKVATVTKSGKVTAKAAGTATITATTSKKTAGKVVKGVCKVTVPEPPTAEVPATLGEAKTRTMTASFDMSKYEAGKVVKIWVPIPQSDEYQSVSGVGFKAPKATEAKITTEEANGNKMLYVMWDGSVAPADRTAELTFTAKRYKVSRADVKEDVSAGYPADAKAAITEESEYVKVNDPVVKEYSAEAVGSAEGTVEKAKAIFDWTIANLERIDNGETLTLADGTTHEYSVDGCGYGDTVKILTELKTYGRAGGHCTDINSTFVALCRAAGIPAREMFGIRMNDDATGGQHCWAEFYVRGTGWVYADPADVLKAIKTGKGMTIDEVNAGRASEAAAQKAAELWCGVDNNRVVLSTGRDITFEPAQAWGVCNTFGYPAAEVDGARIATSFSDAANFVYTIKSVVDRTVFVDTAYVKEAVDRNAPDTVIAEVSWGPDAPAEMIPGAIHVNTDDLESNAQDDNYELWDLRDSQNGFKKLMEALAAYGITTDKQLICYGWGESNSAVTRLAMAALMLGVEDVKVLEGGTKAWFDAGYEKVTEAAAPKAADSFGTDTAAHPDWVVDCDQVVDKVENDPNFKLVSIRSYDEFIGTNSGYAYIDKAGEPKGAIWGRDTDDGTYFADGHYVGIDKINEYLADYGASTDNELAFYCGTGWRATIPFLICYQAGIDNMKLFDDGWYVYCGAYADPWNWPSATDPATLKPVKNYPVQIGDPKTGDVVYTDTASLPADHNALRGLSAMSENVDAVAGGTYGCNFKVMPPKGGIMNSVTFKSSDESVATVDTDGKVTVKADAAAGKTATITATSNALKGSAPGKAGTPAHEASYTVTVGGESFDSMRQSDADLWKKYGIEYADVDYTNDVILDVRTAENYAAGHLVFATNVSVAAGLITDGDDVAQALDTAYTNAAGARIVIVCNSGQSLAARAMDYYRTHGADLSKITYLIGGAKGLNEGDYKNNMGVALADVNFSDDYIIDVRPADMYAAGHLVNAVSVPVTGAEVSADKMKDETKAALDAAVAEAGGKRIVVVCVTGNRLARNTFNYFQSAGVDLKKVTYLIGGANGVTEPYKFGDVTIDPVAKKASIAAKVNGAYTKEAKAISHLVLQKGKNQEGDVAPFLTSAKALDLHAALSALGAKPWSDSSRSLSAGQKLTDVAGDNADFSYVDIKVDDKALADCLKYKKNGVETNTAEGIRMAFSGNKTNQAAWDTGCVSCAFSCYAGVVSNAAIGFGTVNADQNYLYVDTAVLAADQEVVLTYSLSE